MIEVTPLGNAEAVKDYHSKELNISSYYSSDAQGRSGTWHGELAGLLDLEGDVAPDDFRSLCDGKHPHSGGKLTQRWSKTRRVGYDITFTAPKGVSILACLGGDERVIGAFEEATKDTISQMEKDARTRVRAGQSRNHDETRITGNMLVAGYTHLTARPQNALPDPHLHRHYVAFNVTRDPDEQKLKAIELGSVTKQMPIYQAEFHANLAKRLQGLGYDITTRNNAVDVRLNKETVALFSKRMLKVKEEAKALGIENEKRSQLLALSTRAKKMDDLTMTELRRDWERQIGHDRYQEIQDTIKRAVERSIAPAPPNGVDRLKPPDISVGERELEQSIEPPPVDVQSSPETKKVVEFQLRHIFERQSSISVSQFVAATLKMHPTKTTKDAIEWELEKRPELIHRKIGGDDFITMQDVYQQEKTIIDFVASGRDTAPALSISYVPNPNLGEHQNQAVKHILSSRDSVIAIEGKAGTGKTSMMHHAVTQIEKRIGKGKVVVLAPSAQASRKVLRDEGFSNADTVSRFLSDKSLQASAKKGFIWIDEAGLISTKDMNALFQVAKSQRARVILSGDTSQHKSVSRGEAYAILKREAGLRPARLSKIYRQAPNPTYKRAVQHLAEGRLDEGFNGLDRMGALKSVSPDYSEVVESHRKATEDRKSVLLVSPTHSEGKAVTDVLRASLVASGKLGKSSRSFTTLENLHLSDAQKQHSGFIQKGMVLRFHRRTSGFVSGDKATVVAKGLGWIVAIDKKRLRLALVWNGTEKARSSYTVNTETKTELRRGDLIQFTANTKAVSPLPQLKKFIRGDKSPTRINNGAVHKVKATFGRQVLLDNGFVFDASAGTFKHGYVSTSFASQGKTADKVILVQKSSSYANMQRQFYVSASRGRQDIEVFTDNKERLLRSVKRNVKDVSAHELINEEKISQDYGYEQTRH